MSLNRRDSDGESLTAYDLCDLVLELVDHLDAMVAYWDADQTCVFANDAYRLWFGKTRAQMRGITLRDLLGPLYELNLPHIRAAYAGERQVFERSIPTPGGEIRDSLATYTPNIVNGEVDGIFVHVADVTRLKRMERELRVAKMRAEHLATHDSLTGLPNRVLMFDRLELAIAHAERANQMIAVCTLDLDGFKVVNDTVGHGGGDALLIETAARLKDAVRACDTLARMGGDEFVLVAAELGSREEVTTIAERILESIRLPVHLGGEKIRATVSIGIALYPNDGTRADALISASDRALYVAKAQGKARYAFAGERSRENETKNR